MIYIIIFAITNDKQRYYTSEKQNRIYKHKKIVIECQEK